MKKVLFVALLGLIASACHEDTPSPTEKEALLTFDVESVASPDNFKMYYSSPDPGCGVAKFYTIYCDYKANELVLKCNNASEIFIKNAYEDVYVPSAPRKYNVSVSTGVEAVCTYSDIKATVQDANTLRLVFNEVEPEGEDGREWTQLSLTLASSADPAKIQETLIIFRLFDRDIPSLGL